MVVGVAVDVWVGVAVAVDVGVVVGVAVDVRVGVGVVVGVAVGVRVGVVDGVGVSVPRGVVVASGVVVGPCSMTNAAGMGITTTIKFRGAGDACADRVNEALSGKKSCVRNQPTDKAKRAKRKKRKVTMGFLFLVARSRFSQNDIATP